MNRESTAKLLVVAVCLGWGALHVLLNLQHWTLDDMASYTGAAERLGSGELYRNDLPNPELYRYAPWWAALWVPLTALPTLVLEVMWSTVLLTACVALLWPLRGSWEGLALIGIMAAPLIRTASTGNMQPLLLLALVYGVERRSGPVWIALAASLKATPILFALVYLVRREYGKFAWSVGLSAVLVAPMLLFDLSGYPVDPMTAEIPVIVIGTLVGLALLFSPYPWLGAAVAVTFAAPRWLPYQLAYLLVAQNRQQDRRRCREGVVELAVPLRSREPEEGVAAHLSKGAEGLHLLADSGVLGRGHGPRCACYGHDVVGGLLLGR